MGNLIAIPILAVVFSFVLIVIKMAMNHEREKLQMKSGVSDKSLTTSELQAMLEESVQEAIAPLEKRLARLESNTASYDSSSESDPVLPDHASSLNLDDIESLREEPPAVVRERVR
jgi:hypothetical protein